MLSPELFYLRISLIKQHKFDKRIEVLTMHELSLEQMIKLSVFHLNGFNHYVTQLDSSGFDLYVNSHKMVTGIFNQEL